MKLTLGHSDIIAGICMLLESKGMTAFSPEIVEASFSLSRKDGTLSVELDNDPVKGEVVVKDVPAKTKPKAAAEDPAPKKEAPAAEPEPEPETASAVDPVDPAPASDAGDDDNLFG